MVRSGTGGRAANGLLAGLGALALLVAVLGYLGRESAMAVVVPMAAVGLIAGAVAIACLGVVARRATGLRRRLALALLALAAVCFGLLLVHELRAPRQLNLAVTNGDHRIAGTLYLPRKPGRHPGVVLIHGSGAETRDGYRFYAQYLARRGIAAAVYDKRGTGHSTGALWEADYVAYADDALSVTRALAEHPAVDPARIGLGGFSEGGWVTPIVATREPSLVSFAIVVGASGALPVDQVSEEMRLRLQAHGHDAAAIAAAMTLYNQLAHYERTSTGATELATALAAARSQPWFADADVFPSEPTPPDELTWWRSVMDFDARPLWLDLQIPVLLLKGSDDEHSAADAVAARFAELGLDVTVLPGADHMLLAWPLGPGTPPPVFADDYPALVARWIHARH